MSLLFMDGFDYYEPSSTTIFLTGPITRKWGQITHAGASFPFITAGRGTGLALDLGDTAAFTTPPFTQSQTIIVGFAFKTNNVLNFPVMYFMQSTGVQCSLHVGGVRQLFMLNGAFGTTLANGTTSLRTGWYYIEIKVKIDSSTGEIHLKINGEDELHTSGGPITGLNTQTTANAYVDKIRLVGGVSGSQKIFDDFYVLNTITNSPGPANNDFLGDVKVETLFANGAGFHTDWTPLSGSNFSNVDELDTDDDTSYVSTSTASNIDTYTFDNLANIVSGVKAVQINMMHKKITTNGRTIRPIVRHSGIDHNGVTVPVYDSYAEHSQIYQANPGTSTTWTVSDIDNAEFGVELVS